MLAEIFMVRLEARVRLANEVVQLGVRRFVPFVQGGQIAFTERTTRLTRPGLCPAAAVSPDKIGPLTS